MDQVSTKIDSLFETLRLNDLEQTITRDKLEKTYEAIIARNTGQTQNGELETGEEGVAGAEAAGLPGFGGGTEGAVAEAEAVA